MICNKHIKLFESSESPHVFSHLIGLRKLADETASYGNFISGAAAIQEYLDDNADSLYMEAKFAKSQGLPITIYELIYPYYNRWGGEILKARLGDDSDEIQGEIEKDLPMDDTDLENLDF